MYKSMYVAEIHYMKLILSMLRIYVILVHTYYKVHDELKCLLKIWLQAPT